MNKILRANWIGFMTIARKEISRINRIWTQTFLPPAITLTLYFVIFGTLIGPRIGEMGGYSYMAFIVPGLIMMSVITNAYSNTSSSFFGNKFAKSIEEVFVSPLSTFGIIAGFTLGGIYRGLGVGIVVTLISLFFTKLVIANLLIIISVVILCSILFSLAGLLNGIFATKFDDVAIVPTFILTPLTYLGGVFYSINLLPQFWQTVSLLNPILHMVNVFRYGFLGVTDVNIWSAYLMIIIFIGVLFSVCWYMLHKGYGIRQ